MRGIHLIQQVAAFWLHVLDVAANCLNNYLKMLETSALYLFEKFCRKVPVELGQECMREATEINLKRIMSLNASFCFLACIDTIDH